VVNCYDLEMAPVEPLGENFREEDSPRVRGCCFCGSVCSTSKDTEDDVWLGWGFGWK
jgi:hypothetical protein